MIPNGSQVLVTLDIDAAYFVDLSASTSPAAIKERIFAKLGIYDEDHAHYRISRCRAGQPVGQPLDDWQLWDMSMRATKEADPPMLIVLNSSSSSSNHHHHHHHHHHQHHPSQPSPTPSSTLYHHQQQQQQQQQPPYFSRNHSNHSSHNLNHSPNSPDSYSHLKHDYHRSSSAGSRDSPDPSHHPLPTRSRWQRLSRDHLQHARDGSSSSSSHPIPLPTATHPSPITPSLPPEDRRLSPSSNNVPFEVPVYPNNHRAASSPSSSRPPQIDTPEDWVRIQHPSRLSPETCSPTKSRPLRRPSDPAPPHNLPPISTSQNYYDPRLAEYQRQLRSAHSANPKTPSAAAAAAAAPPAPATANPTTTSTTTNNCNTANSTRRFPQSAQSTTTTTTTRRGDLQAAKSMEELHGHHSSNDPRKRMIPGVTHPPLPTDSAAKIAASPALAASRAPPPLRIPRNEGGNMPRPGQPSGNRPSYPPPQTSPSFPFPQPSIASHMRLSRPPGYNPPPPPHAATAASSSSNSSSQGGRFDPRNPFPNSQGRPPPTTSASLSSRNPRVSLQIYEKRYLDQARPPPRPRTGDGSSPIRPSQFQDPRQLQASLGPHFAQQVPGYSSSIPLRPGEILQDSTGASSRRRDRDPSREYRSELEREPAQRRPNMASPTLAPSSSSTRPPRIDDQLDSFPRSPLGVPHERATRRPAPDPARSRPFDPLSSSGSPPLGYPSQDAYGGLESEPIKQQRSHHTVNMDGDQEHSSQPSIERSRPSKNLLSLTIPQANARLSAIGRTERRRANGSPRTSDEMKPRGGERGVGENSPVDLSVPLKQVTLDNIQIPSSTASEDYLSAESRRTLPRGRSATTASTSTGTFTSFAGSSATNTTSDTTPPSISNMFADFEDDDDDVVGTFVTPMQPYMESLGGGNKAESATKPKLSLKTDTSPSAPSTTKPDFQIPQIQQPHDSSGEISATTRSSAPSSDTTLVMSKAVGSGGGGGGGTTTTTTTTTGAAGGGTNGNLSVAERDSRRVSFTGDDWAVRPPIDAVYENLEDFFPHHDLDKPIDIGVDPPELGSPSSPGGPGAAGIASGGSMSTLAVPGSGASASASAAAAAAAIGTSASTMARLKGRTRSIRVVAQEKKKLLRRTEDRARAQKLQLATTAAGGGGGGGALGLRDPAAGGSALLRRKSTKLWGAKIMEVVPGDQVSIPPINEASAGDDDTNNFSFKWVKGELIGKGSFGQVYLALNATNGEMLAVKQVELPKTRSDRECERQKSVVNALKSEIHLMRDLEHPNIVQYLGFEETTVYLSIFLEYVSGGSIGRCLRRHGAFELNVIKYFTSQVLEGLKYLHGLHILHRDLKADNLLVDFSGNCKISDFGISKKSEHVYEDNTQMSLQGSIFWMAPEVVHNPSKKGYSAKVDIWSLGCVVLEMFAGRRPWSDEEAIQAMFKLGAERLRPPVPPDVKLGRMSDHFLAQCFIVDPEARPTADRLTDHRFLEIDNKAWRFEDSELYRSIRVPH